MELSSSLPNSFLITVFSSTVRLCYFLNVREPTALRCTKMHLVFIPAPLNSSAVLHQNRLVVVFCFIYIYIYIYILPCLVFWSRRYETSDCLSWPEVWWLSNIISRLQTIRLGVLLTIRVKSFWTCFVGELSNLKNLHSFVSQLEIFLRKAITPIASLGKRLVLTAHEWYLHLFLTFIALDMSQTLVSIWILEPWSLGR